MQIRYEVVENLVDEIEQLLKQSDTTDLEKIVALISLSSGSVKNRLDMGEKKSLTNIISNFMRERRINNYEN